MQITVHEVFVIRASILIEVEIFKLCRVPSR
jgi:hypothetical protein